MTCSENEHKLVFTESSECGCVYLECLECSHGEGYDECDFCFAVRGDVE